jgi:hypothetical protein
MNVLKADNDSLDAEIAWYKEKIKAVRKQQREAEERRSGLAKDILTSRVLYDALLKEMYQLFSSEDRMTEL